MIKFALVCDKAHAFDSWFPSGEAFDEQRARGLVGCPVCGSTRVEKQIMAPAVARRDRQSAAVPAVPDPAGVPATIPPTIPATTPAYAPVQNLAVVSDQERQARAMLNALREHIVKNAENVGDRFVEEARKMHYGEADARSIYGEASPREARELADEGIDILPLPILADDRH